MAKIKKSKKASANKIDMHRFYLIEAWSFGLSGGLFLAGVVLLVLFFIFNDLLVLFILSLAFFVLFGVSALLRFLFERKVLSEVEKTGQAISDSLDAYAKGSFAFERRNLKTSISRNLMQRFNESLTSFSSILSKGSEKKDEEKEKEAKLMSLTEFESGLPETILNNTSYRSALLAIRVVSREGDCPKEIFDSLYQELRRRYPKNQIAQYDEKTLLLYIDAITDFISFQNKCEGFVSGFAITVPKKNSERISVYGVSLAASIYPLVGLSLLLSNTIETLKKGRACAISMGDGKIYSPALQNESTRRIVTLASIENIYSKIIDASTYEEQVESLSEAIRFYQNLMGFDVGGIYLKEQSGAFFDLFLERGKEGVRGLSRFGNRLSEEFLSPFFEAGKAEFPFFSNVVKSLRGGLSASLRSLDVNSLFLCPVVWKGEVYGLFYLFSKQSIEVPLLYREKIHELAPIVSSFVLDLYFQEMANSRLEMINALAIKAKKYMYTIDKRTYEIIASSESLRMKMPGATKGAICYKALYDKEAPCEDCPLLAGANKTILSALSHSEISRSILIDKNVGYLAGTTILLEEEGATSGIASSSLLDKSLQIRNAKALTMELNREIRNNMRGYLFGIRFVNKDEILSRSDEEGLNATSLMSAINRELLSYGYEPMLFLYDGLTFVMKFAGSRSKTDLYTLIEEIMGNIKGPLYAGNVSFSPKYVCSLISYPNEANNASEALILLKTELDRSASLGIGRVTEVGRSHARGALREDYVLDLIKTSLKTHRQALVIDPIVSASKGNIELAQFIAGFRGDSGERIHLREWRKVADEANLIPEVDFSGMRALGEYYSSNKETAFSGKQIGFLLSLNGKTLYHPEFVSRLNDFIASARFLPGAFGIALETSFVDENSELVERIISSFKSDAVSWWLISYKGATHMGVSAIKRIGFSTVRFASDVVIDARSSESETTAFIRHCAELSDAGLTIACNGVESEELASFLKGLDITYAQGKLYGVSMNESQYLSALSYDNG